MREFNAFLKKEFLDSTRSGRFTFIGILFVAFGIMNPAVAKLTPWLMEMFSESLAESGMTIGKVEVDALTSWVQFLKNIPMALIAFILVFGGIFTKEYEKGTLILLITKGLPRRKIFVAKLVHMLLIWTMGYWMCFGITYGYNAYYWDNSIASALGAMALFWYLFGVWIVCLVMLFSSVLRGYSGVLLGTAGAVIVSYVAGLIPKLKYIVPTALINTNALIAGAEEWEKFSL